MFAQLSRIFRADHTLAEIASLDPRALDDIGLSRTDLARVATAPQAVTDRMEAMADRHGVAADRLAGHGPDLAGMIESCRYCDSVGACRAFLADPSPGTSQAVFCPNHTTFEALCAAHA